MNRRGAVVALWTACLIWGAAFPLTQMALADASPMAFTMLRFVGAAVLVAPGLPDLSRAEWRAGGLLGLLLALGFATQTIGLGFTSASRSGFITALYVPLVPLIVLGVYRRLPGVAALVGLALALTGMVLLTRTTGLGGGLNRGDLLTFGCAWCFAGHMVAAGAFARRYPARHLMMAQVVVAGVLTTLFTPLVETPRVSPTPFLIAMVLYEAVLASVVAIQLQIAAQRLISPTYTALVLTLEPVVAALASLVLVGDRLQPLQWLGGMLIVAGSLMPEFRRGAATAGEPEPAPGDPA
ncbi:MAG TPA: DMT family transporter [Gemmatimonadales bacterium]|nr:DMT family transporter [Gemmatimonadales bacterium]